MKSVRFFALAALLVSAGGCVSTEDVEKLQSQINELQEEVANLKRTASSKDEVQNVNQRIADQTEQLLRSNATLVSKVDQMSTTVQSIQGTVEQSTNRVDRLGQQLTQAQRDIDEMKRAAAAAAAAAVPAPGTVDGSGTPQNPGSATQMTVPIGATDDPAQVYQEAYRDYQRGNFDLAIAGFQDFLKSSPNSNLADNAAYWIAESLFSQKKYRDAIEQFDNVVTRYPRSDKVPGSLLKKGYAYISIGERSQGVVQLQYVVHEHPTSQEAALARQRLKQLGIETR